MVKVGDRIRLSSTKGPDRDGVVTAVTGSLLRVRWPSDEETTVAPAPGTLTVLAASDAVKETAPTKKAARKKSATATKTTSGKKATPDNTRSPNEGGQTTIALINAPRGCAWRSLRRRPLSSTRCTEHEAGSAAPAAVVVRYAQRPMTRRRNPHARRPPPVREAGRSDPAAVTVWPEPAPSIAHRRDAGVDSLSKCRRSIVTRRCPRTSRRYHRDLACHRRRRSAGVGIPSPPPAPVPETW